MGKAKKSRKKNSLASSSPYQHNTGDAPMMDTDDGDMVYDEASIQCPPEKSKYASHILMKCSQMSVCRGALKTRHKLEWKSARSDTETMKKVTSTSAQVSRRHIRVV